MSSSLDPPTTLRGSLSRGYEPPWAPVLRKWKAHWVETTDRGDMPPIVLAVNDKGVMATAVYPEVNNDHAFRAAAILKRGFEPTALWLVADAHVAIMEMPKEMSRDEAVRQARKLYPRGSMQKACDEEGACEAGKMSDCILLARVDRKGQVWTDMIPYSYHGKGTRFEWWAEGVQEHISQSSDPDRLVGVVPATLRQIMRLPPATEHPLAKAVAIRDDIGPDRARLLIAQVAAEALCAAGYGVDVFDPPRPITSL